MGSNLILDAEPNAGASTDAAGIASAGGRGEGADVATGSHGEADTSPDSWFETLAGNTVAAQLKALEQDEGTAAKPAKEREKSVASLKAAKPKASPESESEIEEEDEGQTGESTDKPVLPDDDATTDEDEDGTDDGDSGEEPKEIAKKAKALERDNFKTRERNRELKAALEEKEARLAELERQVRAAGTTGNGLPDGYQKARTLEDVDRINDYWQQQLEWAEDHEDTGWSGTLEDGKEVEYTSQQVRAYRRKVERTMREAEPARKWFQTRTERESKAREVVKRKYPFASNPDSPRQTLMAEIEKAHPEISASPDRQLILARLAVAKLIEDGEYEIAPKTAAANVRRADKRESTPPPPPPVTRKAPRAQPAGDEGDDWAMALAKASMPTQG